MVLPAALHHWPIGVEPIEQHEDGQAREERLEPLAQAVEGALLAVLLVVVGVALGIFEKLAQQGNDQAVAKRQAGLEDVDEVLGVARLLLAAGALQQIRIPQ
ncbi:MAG: hypothetical protein P8Y25_08400, partial [Chromatiaceae bacterium]